MIIWQQRILLALKKCIIRIFQNISPQEFILAEFPVILIYLNTPFSKPNPKVRR
jgi:hypothetical protein